MSRSYLERSVRYLGRPFRGKPSIALMNGYSTTPPKMLGEGEKALRRQGLAAEEDHQMVEPGTPGRRDRVVIKGCRKIDFGDLAPSAPVIGRI